LIIFRFFFDEDIWTISIEYLGPFLRKLKKTKSLGKFHFKRKILVSLETDERAS